jgi:phosphoribosylformylglycinamidine cyclo-ligase
MAGDDLRWGAAGSSVGLPAGRAAYAAAGVDVAAGDRAVELMRARVAATHGPQVLGGIGGFGAAVALPAGYRDPVLVSATDGVGTKTALAWTLQRYDTIGLDLVAMCADDVVCLGARPLFFLDYLAMGRVDPPVVADIVGGVARGCELAGCSLVGGETAEHPGLMEPQEFDLAGFCVGVVERDEILDGSAARPGDVLVGIASSGLHANGYSLVRALLAKHGLDLGQPYQEVLAEHLSASEAEDLLVAEPEVAAATLGEVLLAPTRIYAPDVLALRDELAAAGAPLTGLAHVTGGGLPGNIPRALPAGLAAVVRPGQWRVPGAVRLVAALGGLGGPELRATLNAGIGMVAVVPAAAAEKAVAFLAGRGLAAWVMGEVVPIDAAGQARYVEVE